MRALLGTVLTVLALSVAAPGPALADERMESIPAVIEDQLAAFGRNDLDAAFAHASPGIRAMFGEAATFGRMVETGYPMIWRPVQHQMLELVETPAGPVQTVLFEDNAGRLHEAGYLMELVDGTWRIAGVALRQLPGIGV